MRQADGIAAAITIKAAAKIGRYRCLQKKVIGF
jgi:hypothetical protein